MNFKNFLLNHKHNKSQKFDSFKKYILFTITSLVFLHFLKEIYFYYYLLFAVVGISILTIFIDDKKINFNFKDPLAIILISFFLSLLIINLITLINISDWNSQTYNLFLGIGRLWISPVFAIILFFLINNKDDLITIIYIYIFIFLLAVLSLILQNLFGHIPLFGTDYYGLNEHNQARYTIVGYSSIIGSVVAYGVCFYTAVFSIIFITKFNYITKSLLISLVFIGAILTMSKAAFINIFLILLLLIFLLKHYQVWKILLITIISTSILIYCSTTLSTAVLALSSNMVGIEFGSQNLINVKHYVPILDRIINRFGFSYNISLFESHLDHIFGVGLLAGGGVFKSTYTGTSHNSYIDLYAMGGMPVILTLFLLICIIQIRLLKLYISQNDKISLTLILSNSLLFFNMFFFNGAIFQPLISFSFWLSLIYLLKLKILLFDENL